MRRKTLAKIVAFLGSMAFLCGIGIFLGIFLLGPPPLANDQATAFYSHDGEFIGEVKERENHHFIPLEDISPYVKEAAIAIEDKQFYDHHGFDFKRIIGAVWKNITSGTLKEGASTITQQLARNLYLSHEKTWERKWKEAFYTLRLEMFYSKEEILESYLNTIYFGHGAYGIEAASSYFFDKSARDLTLAEAAMLAGIPKGPSYYSPVHNEEKAYARQQLILKQMFDQGRITEAEWEKASREHLTFVQKELENPDSDKGYFFDEVLKEAAEILGAEREQIRFGGYEIYTTMDLEMQAKLEDAVKGKMADTEMEVGAIAMEPETGAIRAMMGGKNYRASPFNRATAAKRMPGSTFKPFLYYAALEHGFTATTKLTSKPTAFQLEDGKVYEPSNFNDYYANEPITLAQALALSDNVYAVKTNMFLGAERLVEAAREFGIESDLPAVPSLALGTASVSVEEMVNGYAMLANGGYGVEGHTITKIISPSGKVVFEREVEKERTLDPVPAFILTDLMTGMFDRQLNGYAPVTGTTIADQLTRVYAGKSGTTNSDSWMIGFSPNLVAGVWTGYDDNRPITRIEEHRLAKEIWADFMEEAHEEQPLEPFHAPKGVTAIPIDPVSGQRATPYCDKSRVMYFEKGTEPKQHCMEHMQEKPRKNQKEKEEEKGLVQRWFDFFFGG